MFTSDGEWDMILRGLLLGPIALVWIILTVRVIGLRSFSKMAAFDFAVTVAIGSLLGMAATAKQWDQFGVHLIAMASLLGAQYAIARLRLNSRFFSRTIENKPVLLMRRGEFREDALARTRVSKADIWAKLREANALNVEDVHAVILETTGDISVLHGDRADDRLYHDVEGDAGP